MNPLLLMLAPLIAAGPLSISPKSKDLIIEFETGGAAEYVRHPEWPGGASGTTVGIGYDCGYNTRQQILSDWRDLPLATRNTLASTAGVRGVAARPRAAAVRWLTVPWAAAVEVFARGTMPRFGKMTAAAYPGVLLANPDTQGAMLSIVFNRGSDLRGERRREMMNIHQCLAGKPQRIPHIPAEIRAMKRIWKNKGLPGLIRRREAEARLVENSLHP